jgi:hypothetical protein
MEIVDPPTLKNDHCDQSSPKQGIENLYPTKYQFVDNKLDVYFHIVNFVINHQDLIDLISFWKKLNALHILECEAMHFNQGCQNRHDA